MSKHKVDLVFVRRGIEYATINDTFAQQVEVNAPDPIEDFRLIGARIYDVESRPGLASQQEFPRGDHNALIVDYTDEQQLLGRLLTYIDATYTDPQQRKAHKDIVKRTIHEWFDEIRVRAIQTIDAHPSVNK